MSRIEWHGDTVVELNREWSRWIRRLSEMEDELSSLGHRVDPAVAARRRIDARLLTARRSLEQAVARLRALHGFLQTSLGEYRDVEERLAGEAAGLGRLGGDSKSPAHRLWERLEREALSGIGSLGEGVQAAAAEIKDAAGDVVHAGEQVLDSLKAGTDRLWDAVESSAAGSFVEGVTDALAENYTFGLAASQSETDRHRTAYEAGRLVGDVASGIGGLAEGAAAGGMEAGGLALDATGIGAIAGVPLNIAGAAVAGHAASVLYNGAAHFGEDASRLVQSIQSDHSDPKEAPGAKRTGDVQTGGREMSLKEFAYQEAEASKMYDSIRTSTTDVQAISKNTGVAESRIQRIKDHVFNDEHIKSSGNGKFDPDYEIAQAWKRLENGSHTQQDIGLLNHEIFESKFEGIFKTDYETAHSASEKSGRVWKP